MLEHQSSVFEGKQNSPSALTPKYSYVKEAILSRIRSGTWTPGMLIPSELELGREFGVSRITIRRAISDLVHEGKLYAVQGKGTFVARPKVPERFVQQAFGLHEDMQRQGMQLLTTVLRQDQIPASSEVATMLRIQREELVNVLTRIRSVEDEKLLLSTTYIPAFLCPDLYKLDISGSLYQLLRTHYNLVLARGVRNLEAIAAPQNEARLLDVALGSPLLLLDSIGYLADGRIFEYSRTYQRGDRTRVEVEFALDHESS
jgi:GntR family transcriptional regulator